MQEANKKKPLGLEQGLQMGTIDLPPLNGW